MEDRPNGAEPEALRVIAQGRGAQIQETIACPRHRGTLGAFARCTVPYDEKPMLFPFRHARSFLIIALLGTSTYLSAQPGSVGASQPDPIHLWPNPFNDEINIELPVPPSRLITFQLRDLQGNVVQEESLSTMGLMQVNTSAVVPGTYIVYLIAQTPRARPFHQQQVQKFFVQ